MNPEHEKKYAELVAVLPIDLLRIDNEVSVMPQLLQEAAELKRRQAEAKAAVLPAEPPAGTPNVTTIAFRLPDGKRLNRRFAVTETVQVRAQGRGVLRMR